jgi:uncharacterized repeat protein (TIGR02543 family)
MLDVVAPGVLIPTTDIQGSNGYNPNVSIHTLNGGTILSSDYPNQDYTVWFMGTSAACPHAAGIAALILSYRPNLTQTQVRQAIESSCTKLSGYTFSNNSNHPNGTWNNEVGHGLVNAFLALARAAGGYGVTFNLNGASGTPPSAQVVSSGGYAATPSPPTRPGYTFGGWYLSPDGYGAPINLCAYPINTDRTFYVKWLSSNVTSGIDFVINNNSSYELYNVGIELIGKLGTNNYFTTFISGEPGGISPGSYAGYPNNGDDLSVPGGTGISAIYPNIYARITGGGTVYVRANTYVNFSNSGNFISDHLGNDYGLPYPRGSSIPYSGRRMLPLPCWIIGEYRNSKKNIHHIY